MTPDGSAVAHPLPERPRLKPWYRLSADQTVVLRYGGRALELEGRAARTLLPRLLSLLDGTRTVDEVVAAVGEPIRPAVEHAVRLLAAHGVLTEPPPPAQPPGRVRTAELVEATDLHARPAAAAAARLAAARVQVAGRGPAAPRLAELLAESGVGAVAETELDTAGEADLVVAAPADDELPLLEACNERLLATGVPWLQLLPFDGAIATVGPLYVPGATACFHCYATRRAANGGGPVGAGSGRSPAAPAFDALVAGLAGLLALRWLARADGFVPALVYAVEQIPCVAVTAHTLYRVPRCPACGAARAAATLSPWAVEAAEVERAAA